MVYRCYTEKRPGFDVEAKALSRDIREFLGIRGLNGLRIFNRYDVEGIDEATYKAACTAVFAEPQVDELYNESLPPLPAGSITLAVEALPGQFDQRADSCAQCIQMITCGERPLVAAAKLYVFIGITEKELSYLRSYLINPVECREASSEKPETLIRDYPVPEPVRVIEGFCAMDEKALSAFLDEYGLAMDIDDLRFMQSYFRDMEKRDPTETEVRLVDTYWSDHCRHTTFGTHIENLEIKDHAVAAAYGRYISARREVYGEGAEKRPQTLMDIATIGKKLLKKRGLLKNLDESEEINACSIHVDAEAGGRIEDWLLMFKNETHNHPTEIEPFGGAATCIGGAIRDPLSGRTYVYQAMRVTGSGDPRVPISDTLPGKLPQRRLTTLAAAGYSSYGNQVGLATGLVHEIYHPGYIAKRMEVGAVVGAAPADFVVRQKPAPGDVVILLGGRTGRDGIGGATGSSKTHNLESLTTMASEVQKGNPPEERKIQRLFRNPEVTHMIKRCNDFGAGGVSVAIGELADGLSIDLSNVRKKYEGLNATEIAISESQERMAVVVDAKDADRFIELATKENLEAYKVAEVIAEKRMVMSFEGRVVADLSREFLSSNGAVKRASVKVPELGKYKGSGHKTLRSLLSDLRFSSRQGLTERFDGSIGAGSVLMPFGGRTQKTPTQVMAALLPSQDGESSTCSVMSFAFDPYYSEENVFEAARDSVIISVAKLAAAGCDTALAYLSLQEYFERLRHDPERWGKPFACLLGALDAQLSLNIAAIGGKDSMSGSFLDMDVPPTLISFAIAPCEAGRVLSPEFKGAGHPVCLISRENWHLIRKAGNNALSGWAVSEGGMAEGVFSMAVGNMIGFKSACDMDFFAPMPGYVLIECLEPIETAPVIGYTTAEEAIDIGGVCDPLDELISVWEEPLSEVFPMKTGASGSVNIIESSKQCTLKPLRRIPRPKAVIPVFPGTNCEYDTAKAVSRAGGEAEVLVINNLSPSLLDESALALEKAIRESQMLILPGGFSGGDEPDGSGKFIAAFLRDPRITDAIHELLYKRDGLILGICNGFQALIKLGLVPYGKIRPMDEACPTLTFNEIGRHQSRYVRTRICTTASPWLSSCRLGDIHTIPVSHGEGRFVAPADELRRIIASGLVATQYVDEYGNPSMDISVNPNGSMAAIEGLISPDGRVLGKMGHTERSGRFVAKNIPGDKYQPIFESGVSYYR
ncbi:MAG: phosphoribosylformylglycinamidine synthase [Oscillospiraceae bacterium]|jgi:phosphoribosylformylglycinamidine synthase